MPKPTSFLGLLCYAAFCGVIVFLVVLGLGYLIIALINNPNAQSYGATVKGLAVVMGLLYAGVVFFSGRGNISGPIV